MQIILKRAVHFIEREDNIITDDRGVKHNYPKVLNEVRIAPSTQVQYAPDWIKKDPHFDMLVDDDLLLEVTVKCKKKSAESSTDATKSTPSATGDAQSLTNNTAGGFGGFGLTNNTQGSN